MYWHTCTWTYVRRKLLIKMRSVLTKLWFQKKNYQMSHKFLLFNSSYATCRLVNHRVLIWSPPVLQVAKEPLLPNLFILTIVISISLYLLPHVLVTPPNESTRSCYLLRPHAQLIYGPEGNVCHNVGLSLPYLLLDGPNPCYLQGVCHWGLFPLSVHLTPIRLLRNLYVPPLVK